jgi:pyruvate dehydrogenase E1 component beta subunit
MKELYSVQAIGEAIAEEMERDEKVFFMGESIKEHVFKVGAGQNWHKKFPNQMINMPIAENIIAGTAVGAALAGYRPIADFMMSDFFYVAGGEICLNAAKWRFNHGGGDCKLPLVFFGSAGGGFRLGSEHSQIPTGLIMHVPGIKMVLPSNPADAKGLLKAAIRDDNPVVYLYHKGMLGLRGPVPEGEHLVEIGKAAVTREGSDVTLVATSLWANWANDVADELKGKISVEVIDPRTIVPLDIDTIVASVKKTGRLVVADEDVSVCGITAEIAMQVVERAFDHLEAPPIRVAAANIPLPGGVLEQFALPQKADIKAACEKIVSG